MSGYSSPRPLGPMPPAGVKHQQQSTQAPEPYPQHENGKSPAATISPTSPQQIGHNRDPTQTPIAQLTDRAPIGPGPEPLNITILGASFGGLSCAHHFLDYTLHHLRTTVTGPKLLSNHHFTIDSHVESYSQRPKDSQVCPITRFGGVGILYGLLLPKVMVYLLKGHDYRVCKAKGVVVDGDNPYAVPITPGKYQ